MSPKTEALLNFTLGFTLPTNGYLSINLSAQDYDKLTLFGVGEMVRLEKELLAVEKQQLALMQSTGGGDVVSVSNFPATQVVSGTVAVSNFPATQPVSGSVTVSNFPATQAVTGTFWQSTQPVSGTVGISGSVAVTGTFWQATQPVSIAAPVAVTGTFWQATQPVSGTVSTTPAAPPATYFASTSALVPAASATDIFTITGSGSKTVKLTKITITATRTTGTQTVVKLIKRSAANTGGTATNPTAVPADSNDAAATATVAAYTANPAALGASVGDAVSERYFVAGTGTATTPIIFTFGENVQPITLRGTSEVIALNLDATTVTGGSFYISVEWTEE